MTFKEQVRWSKRWGAFLLILGGIVFCLVSSLSPHLSSDRALYFVGYVAMAMLGIGLMFLLFGVVMRPLQRRLYLESKESTATLSGATLREWFTERFGASFWKWWLHVTPAGDDRDA